MKSCTSFETKLGAQVCDFLACFGYFTKSRLEILTENSANFSRPRGGLGPCESKKKKWRLKGNLTKWKLLVALKEH